MSDLGQLATLQLNMLCIIIIICEYLVAQGKELAQVGLSKFAQLSASTRVGERPPALRHTISPLLRQQDDALDLRAAVVRIEGLYCPTPLRALSAR